MASVFLLPDCFTLGPATVARTNRYCPACGDRAWRNPRLLLYLGLLLFTLPLAVVLCLPAHHLLGFSSLKPSHITSSLLHLMMVKTIVRLEDPASLDIVCEQAPTSVTRLNAAFDDRIWVLGFRRHPKGVSLKTKSRTCKVVDLRGGRATITFVA